MNWQKRAMHSSLFFKSLKPIYKIFQFIKKIFGLNKAQILLLSAQDGDVNDQLALAKLSYVKGNYVEAYAWADTASFQGLSEAITLKDEVWDIIPPEQKLEAQNLARKFRMNYINSLA